MCAFQTLAENQVGGSSRQQKSDDEDLDFDSDELPSTDQLAVQLGLAKISLDSALITEANMKEVFEAKLLHRRFPVSWYEVELNKEQLWARYVQELQNEKEVRQKAEMVLGRMRYYLVEAIADARRGKKVVSNHRAAEWYKDTFMTREAFDEIYCWMAGVFNEKAELARRALWFYFKRYTDDYLKKKGNEYHDGATDAAAEITAFKWNWSKFGYTVTQFMNPQLDPGVRIR